MSTLRFICGAECGLDGAGTAGAAVEHWTATTGVPTNVTSGPSPMRSERCYRFNASGSEVSLSHTLGVAIASPATVVVRFYVYFASLPTGNTRIYSSNNFCSVNFVSSDSSLRAGGATDTDVASSGKVITTGRWYRIDVKSVRDSTITVDLQVDGIAQTQYSVAGAAATANTCVIGIRSAVTADMYIDDLAMSGTSGDYPLGQSSVYGLYPSGDGTHVYNAAGDFTKGGTAATNLNGTPTSETTSWQSLRSKADGGLSNTVDNSNFVADVGGATTEFLRWNFENLPANAATVKGVTAVSTHHAASTTANAQTMKLIDVSALPAVEANLLGSWTAAPETAATGIDLSETTPVQNSITQSTGNTTGAWTVANVNDLGVQWGSTDVTPDAYIDGICLEVDYIGTDQLDITPTGATVTITPGVPEFTGGGAGSQDISPTGATVTITPGTPTLALNITPTGATVTVTPGTATITQPVQNITPTGATVTITPGTPSITQNITPTGATVTITAGTAEITQEDASQPLSPLGATVTITPGTPSIAMNVTPTGATVTITPGTPSIAQNVTPSGASVAITAGTATVSHQAAQTISPTGATVTLTPGTPTLDLRITPTGATVTITPGTATVTQPVQAITPVGATVTITAGTAFITDDSLQVFPLGATVTITAGTATVENEAPQAITPTGATVTITPGSVTITGGTVPAEPEPAPPQGGSGRAANPLAQAQREQEARRRAHVRESDNEVLVLTT